MKCLSQLLALVPNISCGTCVPLTTTRNVLFRMGSLNWTGAGNRLGRSLHGTYLRGRIVVALSIFLYFGALPLPSVQASDSNQYPKTDEEWKTLMARASLLDNATLIPSLLPAIMKNRNALDLTKVQLERMQRWREQNYVRMVNIMNDLIDKRVKFRIKSLSPSVSDSDLVALE